MTADHVLQANFIVSPGATTSFAALLCELGRQRARDNSVSERSPVYSGMMSYEKAVRELPFLGFMFEMPIVVAGVGVSGTVVSRNN